MQEKGASKVWAILQDLCTVYTSDLCVYIVLGVYLIFEKSGVYRVDIRKVRCKSCWYQITVLNVLYFEKSGVYRVDIRNVRFVDMRCIYTFDRTASFWYTVNFSNELNDSEISKILNSEFKIRSNSKLMVYSEVSSELNDAEISEFWIVNSFEQQAYGI